MKKAVAIALGLALAFGGTAEARVEHGPVGPTRPGPKRKKCVGNMLFRWCPDGIEVNLSNRKRAHNSQSHSKSKVRCHRQRRQYLRRHPADVPEQLEHIHGCRRYRLDARFHQKETNNPMLQFANRLWEDR